MASLRNSKKEIVRFLPQLALCLLLALCLGLGSSVDEDGSIGGWLEIVIRAIVLWIPLSVVCWFMSERLSLSGRFSVKLAEGRSCKLVAKRAIVLIACWLPYMVLLYPGVLSFDTSFELCQYFGNEMPGIFPMPEGFAFTDHHPITVTLVFGFIVSIGQYLGSASSGLFLLCLLQAVATALSFSYAVATLERAGLSKAGVNALLLFFALFPVFPFVVMTPTKDSLFSWVFLVFFTLLFQVVVSRGDGVKDPKVFALLLFSAVLLSLTKKTGVYILLLSGVVLAVIYRKQWKRFVALSLSGVFVASVVVPVALFPLLNVAPGSKIEVLAPLYQQTARYVVEYPDDVSEEERVAVDAVLGFEGLSERYNYKIVDTVHHAWEYVNQWPSTSEVASYIKTYLAQGVRHPDAYVQAFVSLESGWFDVSERFIFAEGDGMLCDPPNGIPEIDRNAFFEKTSSLASSLAQWIQSLPGLDLLFLPSLYAVIIPFLCCVALATKRKSLLPVVSPIIVSFFFLLLSPVSTVSTNMEAMRYVLPFLYSSPILFAMTLSKTAGDDDNLFVEN